MIVGNGTSTKKIDIFYALFAVQTETILKAVLIT